jgi:hypothetical protein
MPKTLYMVVERFRSKDSTPVYRRLRDKGRMTPEGLLYISGWDDRKSGICYQLMETAERKQFDEWIVNWTDLIEFEIYPIRNARELYSGFWIFAGGRSPTCVIWQTMRTCRRVIRHWLARRSNG